MRSVLSRLTTPGPLLALGLGVTTVAASLWFATANRALTSHSAVTLYSFYFLVGTIGTGVLAGLEQEMTRTVARTHAAGRPVGAAVRGQLRQAAGLAVLTVLILSAASPLLVSHWFAGDWTLALALLAGLAATWASFLVRGVLAGCQDFRYYSLTLVVQGVATIAPSVVLALAGPGHMLGYALIFALAPLVAAVSGLASPALRRSWRATGTAADIPAGAAALSEESIAAGDGAGAQPTSATPDTPGAPVAADTGEESGEEPGGSPREKLLLLTLATLVSQLLINAVPLVIAHRLAGGDAHSVDLGKSLSSSMGFSRLALLCLFPLQAPLLPLLAAAAVRGDFREVRRKTGFLVTACLVAGALGVVAVVAAGPWLLTDYLHAPAQLSHLFLSALALSTAFLMTAFVLQSAQVALNRHRVVFASWLAGLAAMALVFALPVSPLAAAGWAGILGPLVVTLIAGADVMFVTRAQPTVTASADGAADAVPVPVAEAAAGESRSTGQAAPVAEGVRR
ncbi:hypothetical protein Caci_8189 [Catenulispora acidiphila DSM 44928]|uniref:Polysaccharide biosynthesis protein n=2 Tax=Catenulispora TaxID=414878 RepID=C7QIW2_CATAD|nr:hypothetical protein Caci_8189 [Catenulispora acidiphila DSM 44928]